MCTTIADEHPLAKIRHGCDACCGVIAAGDRYHRQRNVDGGDIWTYKAHRLCSRIVTFIGNREHLDWCTDTVDPMEVRQALVVIFAVLFAMPLQLGDGVGW